MQAHQVGNDTRAPCIRDMCTVHTRYVHPKCASTRVVHGTCHPGPHVTRECIAEKYRKASPILLGPKRRAPLPGAPGMMSPR